MREIEPQWNMFGTEARAGSVLQALRTAYTVESADINPYHDAAFGRAWEEKGPHEENLQARLRKSIFPSNVHEHLVLLYEHHKVQGVDNFLKTGSQYESLALSVPWLNNYIRDNPKLTFTIEHVHQASFDDHAMSTFAKDMKARHREDLIPIVQARQSQIALLEVGSAYWLIFPDRHMMLWRYETRWGLLNWTEADFHPAECGDYRTNNGGCSGREVSPDGVMMPEPGAFDETCIASTATRCSLYPCQMNLSSLSWTTAKAASLTAPAKSASRSVSPMWATSLKVWPVSNAIRNGATSTPPER